MANDKKKNMVVASLAIGAIVLTGVGLGYYFYGGTTPRPLPPTKILPPASPIRSAGVPEGTRAA